MLIVADAQNNAAFPHLHDDVTPGKCRTCYSISVDLSHFTLYQNWSVTGKFNFHMFQFKLLKVLEENCTYFNTELF